MVVDGVEAGGGDPAPAEAVVGSALVALRDDLHEFMGWVVEVQDGIENNTQEEEGHAVNITLNGDDGRDQEVQRVLSRAELDAAREDARREIGAGGLHSNLLRTSGGETGYENILSRHEVQFAEGGIHSSM